MVVVGRQYVNYKNAVCAVAVRKMHALRSSSSSVVQPNCPSNQRTQGGSSSAVREGASAVACHTTNDTGMNQHTPRISSFFSSLVRRELRTNLFKVRHAYMLVPPNESQNQIGRDRDE